MKKYFTPIAALTGLSVIALVFSLITPAFSVNAAETPPGSGQALEIAPPVINLSANPGQTVGAEISLRDVSQTNLIVKGQVNDFVADGEDGTPKILIDNGEASPYSMKTWIAALPQLTLKPRQIERLPISIKVPENAAPGGYFAVIRFTATPPELSGQGLSLSASLGALVLLKVNGDAKEGLAVEEFTTTKGGRKGSIFESAPITFVERFKNTGNIHEQPAGQITVTDMFGKKVANVNVNLPPRNILPQSIRRFEQVFDKSVIGNAFLFGRYSAELKVTYGDSNKTLTSSTTFWVIPYTLIALIAIGLIAGFVLLRLGLRRYNTYIVGKSRPKKRW